MPRYPRLFLPEMPVHIVQRGHDRQPVFVQKQDFEYYLDNMVEAKSRYSVKVFAYCLMTNHVHLLASPGKDAKLISKFMRLLAARQTRYTNKKEARTGTLWEGRFKASLVDSAAYLLACCRYIELNPVRARVASAPGDYRWSSYRHHTGRQTVEWLDLHPEVAALGTTAARRWSAYERLAATGVTQAELEAIRVAVSRNQVTGDEVFREALARRVGRRLSAASPGRPATAHEEAERPKK